MLLVSPSHHRKVTAISSASLSSTESRSTVVFCVRTEFGRHFRYIANKGTGDDGMCCMFITVLRVRDQEESTLS